MRQPPRRFSALRILFLAGVVGFLVYINSRIVPLSPDIFLPTQTATVSPELFISQAEALAMEGKFSQAALAYEKAIQADPKNPAVYLSAARLYIYTGKYELALENAGNALLLNPDSSAAEAIKGLALGLQGNYLDAEAALNRAITIDPSNTSAYGYLSIIIAQKIINGEETLGDLDRAIEASRKAQSINPSALETHWARGLVLEITSNYTEALSELQAAIAQNPNVAAIHLALGRNYRYLLQYDKAIEAYTRANALNPADPMPETYISRTYANVGEYAKAIQYAEQAVADAPDNAFMYGNLGIMYKQNFLYESAIQVLRLAVRGGTSPEGTAVEGLPLAYGRVVEFYYNYGLALMELGYCGEAFPIAQSIIQSMRDDPIAIYNANFIIQSCNKKANDNQVLKLPTPTMFPTWTPRPSPTPTVEPTRQITPTP